jgi:hypothetical protein
MYRLDNLFDTALQLLAELGGLIVAVIVGIELWMRDFLSGFGLSHGIQTTIMMALTVFLIVMASKLLGGMIRAILLLILVMSVSHIVVPAVFN